MKPNSAYTPDWIHVPVFDDTMVQNHAAHNLRHLTDDTVSTNDRLLDARSLANFRGIPNH
jgi:hypothetical protein